MVKGHCNSLNYSKHQLRDEDIPSLRLSQEQRSYVEIDFSSNQLTSRGLEPIVKFCCQCPELRVFKAYKNEIDDDGAWHIAKLLEKCGSIEEIHLSHNYLTAPAAVWARGWRAMRSRTDEERFSRRSEDFHGKKEEKGRSRWAVKQEAKAAQPEVKPAAEENPVREWARTVSQVWAPVQPKAEVEKPMEKTLALGGLGGVWIAKDVDPKADEPKETKKAKAKAKKEEPKKEEPKREEPKKLEPKKEEPKKEEPKKEEPKKEEPKREEPKREEPKKEEPKKDEPRKEEKKEAHPTEAEVKVEVKTEPRWAKKGTNQIQSGGGGNNKMPKQTPEAGPMPVGPVSVQRPDSGAVAPASKLKLVNVSQEPILATKGDERLELKQRAVPKRRPNSRLGRTRQKERGQEPMSAASSPCQSPVRQRCARCGLSLDTASLLLVCEHNLCLHCAAQLLENHGAAGHRVACKVCQAVTEVDTSAATYLESLLSPSTSRRRGPYGSEMSTQLPLAGSLSPFTAAVSVSPALSAPDSPPRSGTGRQRCGQCEERADLLCSQCQEVFCRRCGTAVHQRGRMARHQLQALSCEAEAAKKATPSPREAPKSLKSLLGRIQELRLELAQALAEAQQQMQQQMQKAIAETSIIAMHQQLSRSLESGDVLQALISFVKLQEAMAVEHKSPFLGFRIEPPRVPLPPMSGGFADEVPQESQERLQKATGAKKEMIQEEDHKQAGKFMEALNAIIKEDLEPERQCHAKLFGSMSTGFGTQGLSEKLEYGGRDVDISVNNDKALKNSRLLHAYAQLDPLIAEFGIAVKLWAKDAQLCGAKDGHLRYGDRNMVRFPRMPSLQEGLDESWVDDEEVLAKRVKQVKEKWKMTTDDVWTLLAGFFAFYAGSYGPRNAANPFVWGTEVVSIRLGTRSRNLQAPKAKEFSELKGRGHVEHLHIEDPVEQSRNLRDVLRTGNEELLLQEMRMMDLACRQHAQQMIIASHAKLPDFNGNFAMPMATPFGMPPPRGPSLPAPPFAPSIPPHAASLDSMQFMGVFFLKWLL
eukprot:g24243.t1